MKEPKDVVYDACRHYINDQTSVAHSLIQTTRGYLRARDLGKLSASSDLFDPTLHGIEDWRYLRQVEAFFKKNSIFADPVACSKAAEESFLGNERHCAAVNRKLDFFYEAPHLLDEDTLEKLDRMRRYIKRVLGPYQPFIDDLPSLIKVTSGATAHAPRRMSQPQMKMSLRPYSTERAAGYIRALIRYFGFSKSRIRICDSNRVEEVPKNWKTNRTIACEPDGLVPIQLAFDTYVKRRLKKFRINLSDQSANQNLAQRASVDESFVTVDHKAASDTISFNVVSWLFRLIGLTFCTMCDPQNTGDALGKGRIRNFPQWEMVRLL